MGGRAEEALEEGERRTQLVEHMKKWNDLPSFTVVLIRMQDVHKREMIETQVRACGHGMAPHQPSIHPSIHPSKP